MLYSRYAVVYSVVDRHGCVLRATLVPTVSPEVAAKAAAMASAAAAKGSGGPAGMDASLSLLELLGAGQSAGTIVLVLHASVRSVPSHDETVAD